MANFNNYRDFDEIARGIKIGRSDWEKGTHKRTGNSYTHIWQIMNNDHQFFNNERNDYKQKISDLKHTYHPDLIAKQTERIDMEFDKMVAVVVAAHRSMIKEFTRSRHEQVTKMMRTAPTQSMLNLLETLKMRDDLDAVELHDLLPVFFDNYHAMRALQTISRENGIILHAPVQLDCASMHKMIDEAEAYLLGACAEMCKPKSKVDIRYHDFFTVNNEEKDKVFAPAYQSFIEVLDYVPQLQDCSVVKNKLSAAEKAKIDWYYRDVAESATKKDIAEHTKSVMEAHPEMVDLLKLSDYAEYVEIVEAAKETA